MATYETEVHVLPKSGVIKKISSKELVPGDIIEITDKMTLPCDAIMLKGLSILNESMLTGMPPYCVFNKLQGESIPVIKTPLPENDDKTVYSVEADNKHTLFAGTIVVQSRPSKSDQRVTRYV
jgi:cation-transporting ATPase 13A2